MNRISGVTAVRVARRHPRRVALGVACFIVLVWLLFAGTDRTTSKYWNDVHALSRRADAVQNLETPEEIIAALTNVEQQLLALDREGVDPRAIEAVNRFREALIAARRCVEEGKLMLDHPLQTAGKAAIDTVLGRTVFDDLRKQIVHVREVTVEAYGYSTEMHRQLSWRYPLSRFATPIPPDFAQLDEALRELEQIDQESKEWTDLAKQSYKIGLLLGAVAGALFGG